MNRLNKLIIPAIFLLLIFFYLHSVYSQNKVNPRSPGIEPAEDIFLTEADTFMTEADISLSKKTDFQTKSNIPLLWVVDASNSMWGRIKDRMKIKIAAEIISDFMKTNNKYDFGLLVFGHRSIDNCYDIELLFPPEGNNIKGITDFLNNVKPLGKTPLEESLKYAGDVMKKYPNGYIILISDGKEACYGDPCEAAKLLKERELVLGTYVIGYTEKISDRPWLKCIVEETKGKYYVISDVRKLNQDLQGDTLFVQKAYSGPVGEIRYRCFLRGRSGLPAYGTKVILKDPAGNTVGSANYWRGIIKQVPVGKLILTAVNGDSVQSKEIIVEDGKKQIVSFTFSFQTGTIKYQNRIEGLENGKAFGTVTQIYHTSGEIVFSGTQADGLMADLPIGKYLVKAENTSIVKQKEVELNTGGTKLVEFSFKLGKGRIGYMCYLDSTKNISANGTKLTFFRDPYQEQVLTATDWRGNTTFLPEGDYIIEGDYQGITKRMKVSVYNDSTSNVDLIFNLKNVTLNYKCFVGQNNAPASGVVVEIINPRGESVQENNGWRGRFIIPEGSYQIKATFNSIVKFVDIDLNATDKTQFDQIIIFEETRP